MENFILRSGRGHFIINKVQPLVSERRSRKCSSLCSLVDCGQQRNFQCFCKSTCNNLLLKSTFTRRHTSNRQWTSSTMRHVLFSTKPSLRKEPKVIILAIGSDTDNDAETTLPEKARTNPGWSLSENLSNVFKADKLGVDIALIALPAAVALAADPIASLVDTAFVGRIGSVELAAVGVSISVFNLVSKMFNIPLLNVTTSFVAEDSPQKSSNVDSPAKSQEYITYKGNAEKPIEEEKFFLSSISSALVLGTILGIGQAFVLSFFAGPVLTVMGVGVTSPMRTAAIEYLVLRAFGAPAVVVALAVQGVFRGFKDTKTPLYASVAGNLANVVLDPILMFSLNLGVGGAAIATVVSQYLIAGLLLWNLNKRVVLLPTRWGDLSFNRFLTSGGYLLGRTIAILLVFTIATSMAARQGATAMAAHQICVQIWLAISLLSDSLALAGQSIVASAFSKKDYKLVKEAAIRVLQIGCGLGLFAALILASGMAPFSRLFTNDASVLDFVGLLLPFVVLTQPINALAFVFDGLHYGVSDFEYAAISMMALTVPSILTLLFLPKFWGISGVWVGFTTVMSLRMLTGFWRMKSTTGPWRFLNQGMNKAEEEL